ncbi:MAG: V-type ATPase 116kDa subunit family protein [Candidatus Peregrinibacteria bacterium]|nr:V-type ATPase 116kDa subunit family protein [Candidatus Peregrinibacteria bacterium]
MAIAAMQKIEILGMKKDLPKMLQALQETGVMQIEEVTTEDFESVDLQTIKADEHDLDYTIANVDFALKQLLPHAPKRSFWKGKQSLSFESAVGTLKSFDYKALIKKVADLEEAGVSDQNALNMMATEKVLLTPWKKLAWKLDTPRETDHTNIYLGSLSLRELDSFKKALEKAAPHSSAQKSNEVGSLAYLVIAVSKNEIEEAKNIFALHKFEEVDIPGIHKTVSERLKEIKNEREAIEKRMAVRNKELAELGNEYENLQIVHDVLIWQLEDQTVREKLTGTHYSVMITGWITKENLGMVREKLSIIATHTAVEAIKPKKDEHPPILLKNKLRFQPFEAVTKLYGFPLASEVDPTPFLATFFIFFFALCLTDSGYGLTLFIVMFVMLRFMNLPKESHGLIRLLMWGGLLTMIMGIPFGGYFGLTPEQAPAFMVEGGQFKWQLINPTKGDGPIMLLTLSLILGVLQVIVGILIDGFWKLKQRLFVDAILDSFLWVAFLLSIIGYALASLGKVIPTEYASTLGWSTLALTALLVLTQGRKQKSIAAKIGLGVLSLYNLVGYFSDVLSYSRLMALGLATGIIAFAMNTIAGLAVDLIPYVGIVVAVVILIVGHAVNLVLSALSAFIHSARLQFVEFFGKFMEGGGKEFKPFKRTCKYIVIN